MKLLELSQQPGGAVEEDGGLLIVCVVLINFRVSATKGSNV